VQLFHYKYFTNLIQPTGIIILFVMRRFFIGLIVFLYIGAYNNYAKMKSIDNERGLLSQIIGDSTCNLKERIMIIDDIQEKVIKEKNEVYATPGSDDDISNVCITAFMKWCDKFVGGKRDYVVLRLPFNKRVDRNRNFWPPENKAEWQPYNKYEAQGSQIIFDPFIESDTLNGFLTDSMVVVAISKIENAYVYVVNLNAVLPLNGRYFRYITTYYFFRQIDFNLFKTKDIDVICERIGHLISNNPQELLDSDGWLAMSFLIDFFKWDFDTRRFSTIQEINIDPKNEKITIKSLFYDND